MTDNTNIHQRIGEAITSGGEFNIIRANNAHEEQILTDAGFVKVGSMKEGDKIVSLFKIELKEKEIVKIVEVPNNKSWPFNEQSDPFRKPDPGIWYYNQNNPLYTYGNNADVQYTNPKVESIYNPLSVLGNYIFPKNDTSKMDDLVTKIAKTTEKARNV